MTPALAIDALMTHPRYADYVEQMRAEAPPGLLDQADAAATDAHGIMTAGAIRLRAPGGPQPMNAAAVPEWIRLGLVDTLALFIQRQAATCPHNPDAWHPQPVLAAAWRPGLVVCAQCPHLFALRAGTAADRTCDGCGHLCGDVDSGDAIYPGLVQLGPLVYQYGTCIRCRPPYADGNPLSSTETDEQTPPRGRARVKPRGKRGTGRGRR